MPASHPALGYAFLTPFYEWAIWLGVPEKKIREELISRIKPGDSVLDFGSGTGTFLKDLLAYNPSQAVCGLDTDAYMVKTSRKKGLPVDFYTAGSLPYPDQKFDVVTSTWVFQHFSEEEVLFYFQEIRRILKPTGVFWLGDWGPSQGPIQAGLSKLVHWIDPTQNGYGPADLWPGCLLKCGFQKVIRSEPILTRLGTFYYWQCLP
ncbi:class I SAM-dependent methyltransferase [Siphonobacter sp. SORGH_AS_1065]|uniref:class I SAM-dependent methyltransferase n=1 Tax=Siphonobacter sp. SORGH_AS_1065 TaxID=3041795 RepID=UPI00278A6D28|nr:class I SAM-dependent methyltransferase [Siphonobacter sp. SORGH_AS_1065]MDQ1087883.1 SAM-dependent methyltransferase [Siphonobacter sp. SORGH_AS_1065]